MLASYARDFCNLWDACAGIRFFLCLIRSASVTEGDSGLDLAHCLLLNVSEVVQREH